MPPTTFRKDRNLHDMLEVDISSPSTPKNKRKKASDISAPPLSSFRKFSDKPPAEHDDEEGHFVDEPAEDFGAKHDNARNEPPPRAEIRISRRRDAAVILVMCILAILTAVLAGIVMTVKREREATDPPLPSQTESDANSSTNESVENITNAPGNVTDTDAESVTVAPSAAPDPANVSFSQEQIDFLTYHGYAVEWSGQDAIGDTDSPASKALNWIINQDSFHLTTEDAAPLDIQQRYVSAVLYFSMMDENNRATTVDGVLLKNFLSDSDVCFWNTRGLQQGEGDDEKEKGIVCNENGIITQLQFENMGIGGYLPKEIGHLSSLEILKFADNFLTGSIPLEFSNLVELKEIDVRNCSLVGLLPNEVSELHEHLEYLLLSNNGISGPLPSSFGALTSLRFLDLAFNDLTGEIPNALNNLQAKSVRLNGNSFSGTLDPAFCTDVPTEELVADCLGDAIECSCCTVCCNEEGLECKSAGPGPIGETLAPEVANERISKLQALLESISGLEALQNPESDQHKVLQWMAQSDPNPQDLDATDPIFIVQKYVLILIFVSTNGNSWKESTGWLSGGSFCSWDGISCSDGDLVDEINLANRNCHGMLVTEIGALRDSLTSLKLKNNPLLSGELPSELGALTALSSLDVSHCQFFGSLPREVGKLSDLFELMVDDNDLTGPLPTEIGNLGQLKFLDISRNDISGIIPLEIGKMESLVTLAANDCNLTSTLPSELGNLNRLVTLDLSRNVLSGNVPSELGALTLLESIYLNENLGINGTLPQGLAFLPNLREFHIHGTSIIGNLDLLFCTGEVYQVTSNCLDPLVICRCCSICCNKSGEKCEQP